MLLLLCARGVRREEQPRMDPAALLAAAPALSLHLRSHPAATSPEPTNQADVHRGGQGVGVVGMVSHQQHFTSASGACGCGACAGWWRARQVVPSRAELPIATAHTALRGESIRTQLCRSARPQHSAAQTGHMGGAVLLGCRLCGRRLRAPAVLRRSAAELLPRSSPCCGTAAAGRSPPAAETAPPAACLQTVLTLGLCPRIPPLLTLPSRPPSPPPLAGPRLQSRRVDLHPTEPVSASLCSHPATMSDEARTDAQLGKLAGLAVCLTASVILFATSADFCDKYDECHNVCRRS